MRGRPFPLALVALAALTACLPDQTLRDQTLATYDPGRYPGFSLSAGSETAELTRLLEARAPQLRLHQFPNMTEVSLSGVGVLFLTASAAPAQAPTPPVDLPEREAIRHFVLDGGHLVLLLDRPGMPGVNEMLDLVRRFGLDASGDLTSLQRVRIEPDAPPGLRDGRCGPVRELSVRDSALLRLGSGWRGVALADGSPIAAYLPAGTASPAAGSVFVLGHSTGVRTQGGDAATRLLVCNAILNGLAQVAAP
jgi:hypothetical protein